MRKQFLAIMVSITLISCSNVPIMGKEKDAHGCLTSASQHYSFLKKECIPLFNAADIALKDPQNETLAIYIIFSEDHSQAEVFAAGLPENTILESVKGGYFSKESKIRLMKINNDWEIKK